MVAITESAFTTEEESKGVIADIMIANTHKIIATVGASITSCLRENLR
jgi:hypothetical protein